MEGGNETAAIDEVELITLENEETFHNESGWCQESLNPAAMSLDGATIDMINTFDFLAKHLGDPVFIGPHNSQVHHRVIVCGGANTGYAISPLCR